MTAALALVQPDIRPVCVALQAQKLKHVLVEKHDADVRTSARSHKRNDSMPR